MALYYILLMTKGLGKYNRIKKPIQFKNLPQSVSREVFCIQTFFFIPVKKYKISLRKRKKKQQNYDTCEIMIKISLFEAFRNLFVCVFF